MGCATGRSTRPLPRGSRSAWSSSTWMARSSARTSGSARGPRPRAVLVPDYNAIDHPVTKILAPGEEPLVAAALVEARVAFAGRAMVTISHPRFLEFAAAGVSMGRAVRWLARRLGVPLEQTMAIGDERNDLEMIAAVGHGVAMPTAPNEVRSVARYVAAPLEDEGAAQMIEALVLAGRAAPANA